MRNRHLIHPKIYRKGMVSKEEWDFLYSSAVETMNLKKPILEIGSYAGCSTSAFAYALKEKESDQKIISLDNYEDSTGLLANIEKEFIRNMEELKLFAHIEKIKTSSLVYQPQSDFSLIFVDGYHEYNHVKQELDKYHKYVSAEGIFCGHDYSDFPVPVDHTFYGVRKAVNEFINEHGRKYEWIEAPHTVWALKKIKT